MIKQRCREDLLYFVNVFGWVFEPRATKGEQRVKPFVTWAEFQDELLLSIQDAVEEKKCDLDCAKSRDMGASWCFIIYAVWVWLFDPMTAGMLVSRKEDLVDKRGSSDTLFWKVMFIVQNLPSWMQPKYEKTHLLLKNEDNGSMLTGAATTGDVGRGGRQAFIFFDEFAAFSIPDGYAADAASQANTNTRMRCTTPQGASGCFFDCFHDLENGSIKIRLHWSKHPLKNPGLYTAENNKLKIIDTDYEFPPDYNFILDGRLRSPWYDKECKRAALTQNIAQELDIDFLGSGFQYFDNPMLDRVAVNCCSPAKVGEISFDDSLEDPKFIEQAKGRMNLWIGLDHLGRPPRDRAYIVACDIATGTGASNSAAFVLDRTTGEQVADFITPNLRPDEFARYVVAICNFFEGYDGCGAFLIWESNGPGRSFGDKVLELNYMNIFLRDVDKKLGKKKTDIPGWHTTKENKISLFGEFANKLGDGKIVIRSSPCLEEAREYVYDTGSGAIIHARSKTTDPSGAGDNHGDRVISAVLACRAMRDAPKMSASDDEDKERAVSSFYSRRQERMRQVEYAKYDW